VITTEILFTPARQLGLQTSAALQILLGHAVNAQIAGGLRWFAVTQANGHERLFGLDLKQAFSSTGSTALVFAGFGS
jgi:hypothetical protein